MLCMNKWYWCTEKRVEVWTQALRVIVFTEPCFLTGGFLRVFRFVVTVYFDIEEVWEEMNYIAPLLQLTLFQREIWNEMCWMCFFDFPHVTKKTWAAKSMYSIQLFFLCSLSNLRSPKDADTFNSMPNHGAPAFPCATDKQRTIKIFPTKIHKHRLIPIPIMPSPDRVPRCKSNSRQNTCTRRLRVRTNRRQRRSARHCAFQRATRRLTRRLLHQNQWWKKVGFIHMACLCLFLCSETYLREYIASRCTNRVFSKIGMQGADPRKQNPAKGVPQGTSLSRESWR